MKLKIKPILFGILLISIGFIIGNYYFILKPNLTKYCYDVAINYLERMEKLYNIKTYGEKEWIMAVDVETDLHKLCTLSLDEQSLKSFKSTIIEKYQK